MALTYYERNKEKIKAKYRNNPELREYLRNAGLKHRFGITIEQYNTMLDSQHHVCAICGAPDGNGEGYHRKRLAVDHCHATGKLRRLLCQDCNIALGKLKDDPGLFLKAAQYLIDHR
jgi:hypothetical protein